MRFIVGLLAGALGTLAISTLAGLDWEPPSRLDEALLVQAEPLVSAEAVKPADEPQPIRSVTIDPLPAEPVPQPAPAVSRAALPDVSPPEQPKQTPLPEPDTSAVAAAAEPAAPEKAVDANAEVTPAVVWKPFHSEVSASGFARRLSTQLGYPFRALREGPAKYHVVFDYDTQEQRELLRTQVQALTGFSVI